MSLEMRSESMEGARSHVDVELLLGLLAITAWGDEDEMSQNNVERVIGLLATDEAFRRRFEANPQTAMRDLVARGMELTSTEVISLSALDPRELSRFARSIDPRLQKCDLHREASS
jgi:hypothetical protein